VPTSDYAPVVQDVGNILRARTKTRAGAEVGTFNADTRPTDVEVEGLINRALGDVAMVIGSDTPAAVWDDAKSVVALRAALLVELGYFPEQLNTGRSPYPQLKVLYDDDLKNLVAAVTKAGGDPGEAGAPMKPSYAFPMTGDPFIIGRRTAW
jgi:hypothetical protein